MEGTFSTLNESVFNCRHQGLNKLLFLLLVQSVVIIMTSVQWRLRLGNVDAVIWQQVHQSSFCLSLFLQFVQ